MMAHFSFPMMISWFISTISTFRKLNHLMCIPGSPIREIDMNIMKIGSRLTKKGIIS